MATVIKNVAFGVQGMFIVLSNNVCILIPLIVFPTLYLASVTDLNNFEISGDGTWLHWKKLDENLSLESIEKVVFSGQAFRIAT